MAWTLVASTTAQSTNSSSVTSTGIDTTGATLLVVAVPEQNFGSDTANATFSDNKGNVWTMEPIVNASQSAKLRFYWCIPTSVGTGHTFTYNSPGASPRPTLLIQAWSGNQLSGQRDTQNGANGGATTASPGSMTTTFDGDLVISALCNDNASVSGVAINSSFTKDVSVTGNAQSRSGSIAHLVQTSRGAINPQWSWSGASGSSSIQVAFKPAPTGSTFTQSVGGGITPAATLVASKLFNKAVAGVIASAASLIKKLNRPLGGGLAMFTPTLPFNYAAGDTVTGETFSRGSASSYRTSTPGLDNAGSGVKRDSHYIDSTRTMLLEVSRTNRWQRSEEFDNAYWPKLGATVTANATTAPDGNTTADKVAEDSSSTTHGINASVSGIDSTKVQVVSIFVKAAERSFFRMWFDSTSGLGEYGAYFNLSTGAVSANTDVTAYAENYGNGWWRCSIVLAYSAGHGTLVGFRIATTTSISTHPFYAGTNGSGVYMWGAQWEQDVAYPSSYIATTTVTATRSADAYSFAGVTGTGTMTLQERWLEIADPANYGALRSADTAYTAGTTITLTAGRAYTTVKVVDSAPRLSKTKIFFANLSGGGSPSGSLIVSQASRFVNATGTIASSGAVTRLMTWVKVLAGALSPSGVVGRIFGKYLSGIFGAGWEASKQIESSEGTTGLAVEGNTIHAVVGPGLTRYTRSTDRGVNWSAPVTLSSYLCELDTPIAVHGNRVGLLTMETGYSVTDAIGPRASGPMHFRKSDNGGVTWTADAMISSPASRSFRIGLAISQNGVFHAVAMDFRNRVAGDYQWDLYYWRSADGVTWTETLLTQGVRPSIACDGDDVHISWMDGRDIRAACPIEGGFILNPCTEVYYKRSTDDGLTWEADQRLTNSASAYSGRPNITALNGNVLITYDYNSNNGNGNDIRALRNPNRGAPGSWAAPVSIPGDVVGDQTHSFVAFNADGNGEAWATWQDRANTSDVKSRAAYSMDKGATWSASEVNTDAAAGQSGATMGLVNVARAGRYVYTVYFVSGAGTRFRRKDLGALGGALTRKVGKLYGGTIAPTGTALKKWIVSKSGAVASAGVVAVRQGRSFAGAITSSGVVQVVIIPLVMLAGTVSNGGVVNIAVRKAFNAALPSQGIVRASASRLFEGVSSTAGRLSAAVSSRLAASVQPEGVVTRSVAITLTGLVEVAGAVSWLIGVTLIGAVNTASFLSTQFGKVLGGLLQPIGYFTRLVNGGQYVTGNVAPTGHLDKRVQAKILGGTIGLVGKFIQWVVGQGLGRIRAKFASTTLYRTIFGSGTTIKAKDGEN